MSAIPHDCDRGAVAAAEEALAEQSLGWLLVAAMEAAQHVGPWMPDAPVNLAAAYRHAEDRRAIAEAIEEQFGSALHASLSPSAQQWWHDGSIDMKSAERPLSPFDEVYGAGQFTLAGIWTVSDPPPEVHCELIEAWELGPDPVSRWQLPIRPDARPFEVHRPADWVQLVTAYPATGRPHPEWELPGPNQRSADLSELLAVDRQHGVRTSIRRHVVPDWVGVAADFDSVHLSWAGFLTSEGFVSDLGDGDVALLRYWFSERTHWVRDAFIEPIPLSTPHVDPDRALRVVDVRYDQPRRNNDLATLSDRRGWLRPFM